MNEIRTGEVTMTPRLYFTLKVAALFAVGLVILLLSILIFNFIVFSVRIVSHDVLLGFGQRGVVLFLSLFPWHLLAIDVGFVILLQYMLRYFKMGYKFPLLHVLGGLFVATVLLGFALDAATPLNDRLLAGSDRLPPPIARMYEGARKPPPPGSGVCRCAIVAIEGNRLIVEDTRDATSSLTVVLPLDSMRATTTGLSVGDIVLIAGDEDDGVIRAFGVRKQGPRKPPRPDQP